MNGIFGSFYGSGWLTTTEVDHTPASVLAFPTCRSAGSHGKTGIESLMAIESSPPRYWQGCITNIAWNLWRREPLEGIRRRTTLLRITRHRQHEPDGDTELRRAHHPDGRSREGLQPRSDASIQHGRLLRSAAREPRSGVRPQLHARLSRPHARPRDCAEHQGRRRTADG